VHNQAAYPTASPHCPAAASTGYQYNWFPGLSVSDDKTALLKIKFGFDEAINYKTTNNIRQPLPRHA